MLGPGSPIPQNRWYLFGERKHGYSEPKESNLDYLSMIGTITGTINSLKSLLLVPINSMHSCSGAQAYGV